MGFADLDEPFSSLLTQGMVLKDGYAMSKSRGNIVSPTEMLEKYGADVLRFYMLSVALPESEIEWSDEGIPSAFRSINRLWSLVSNVVERDQQTGDEKQSFDDRYIQAYTEKVIGKVTEHFQELKFSLASTLLSVFLDTLREYVGLEIVDSRTIKDSTRSLVLMLTPFIPHVCEELWTMLGENGYVSAASWPAADKETYDAEILDTMDRFDKVEEDIKNILKVTKVIPKKAMIYVIPSELEKYSNLPKHLERHLNIEVVVYATDDAEIYDPDNKAKAARFGRPGIYLE